jgi:adenine-specific DNA glycosylase
MIKPLRDDLMVQQQVDDAWQHFVGVIMLNQTGRKAVKTTLPEFLYWFPTALSLLHAEEEFVKSIIQPLGMVNVRYNRLIRMSQDYLTWDGNDATMLYGIGKYGSDSYEIFFKKTPCRLVYSEHEFVRILVFVFPHFSKHLELSN